MPLLGYFAHRSPVVIGATGGSGTRALRQALSAAGVFMGRRLNEAGDAMDFEPFLDEAIDAILSHTRSLDYRLPDLPRQMRVAMRRRFAAILSVYAAERPRSRPWGWKNPRSMYILPLILDCCPGLRFVHLVRDGREMALSVNQIQPKKHYAALTGHPLPDDLAAGSIELWSRANLDVMNWSRIHLGARYRLLRFEDLCADPGRVMEELLCWIGSGLGSAEAIAKAVATVAMPPSLGRWRGLDPARLALLESIGSPALRAFNYKSTSVGAA